jgi:hypothetical protein
MGLSRAQTQAFSNAGIQSLDHKDREIESGGGVHEADDEEEAGPECSEDDDSENADEVSERLGRSARRVSLRA